MKKKFYMVLDTETATLPFANEMCKTAKQKQKIAIAKPLVYDIGWVIVDRLGNVYKKVNYLVQETFFVPNVFNTAYYKDKRPLYMKMLTKGEIMVDTWDNIIKELIIDLNVVDMTTAYNACFDFKKAIPFTERYIKNLYSENYSIWEEQQKQKCYDILDKKDDSQNDEYLKPYFELRNTKYPLCDLWGLACDRLINIDKYRNYCLDNGLLTNSALYFKTSAEISFQYLMKNYDFIEDHTALSDAEIEAQILVKALKKGKIEPMIKSFPFKELGYTYEYVQYAKSARRKKYRNIVADMLENYMNTIDTQSGYYTRLQNILYEIGY